MSNRLCGNRDPHALSRRQMLAQGVGFGSVALAAMLAEQGAPKVGFADSTHPTGSNAAPGSSLKAQPLVPRPPHFEPKAKRVIFLFMHGGPSTIDLLDYKPVLAANDNKPLPFAQPRVVSSETGNLLASPWKFTPRGQCGTPVSELLPHHGSVIDDLCVMNSVHGSNSRHGAALLELHTGSDTFVRPSMGSWINYGLGTVNQNLPGFITICPSSTHGGLNAWSSAFLPAHFQGTSIGREGADATSAKVPFITQSKIAPDLQRMELDALRQINADRLSVTGPDSALEARIESFELAFRMQSQVPAVQDLSGEPEHIRKMYGLDKDSTKNFGTQCLLARRFAEAGVRFVQVTHSYWDSHGNLKAEHAKLAGQMDQPAAALIKDLKQRGMLDDTLVLWGGEFGRTPTAQGRDGRDHNPHGMTMWMAGGGVRGGMRYGSTDEFGYYAVDKKIHFHDLHATILHLLGLDHTALTYRHVGRDFRLTDLYGHVVKDIIA